MISEKKIHLIEKILQYKFKNTKNLIISLIHPSVYKHKKKSKKNDIYEFERLEFLGDRVLDISIASLIFDKFTNYNEGDLTKKLSYLVQKKFLYKIAIEIEIDKVLKYSFKKNIKRMDISILADSVESLIGSIFLDSGFKSAYKFIQNIWGPYLSLEESNKQDPKTKLQEISQYKYKSLPKYSVVKKIGPFRSL